MSVRPKRSFSAWLVYVPCLILLLVAAPAPARAQGAVGSISGTIIDSTGAVLPGVLVTCRNKAKRPGDVGPSPEPKKRAELVVGRAISAAIEARRTRKAAQARPLRVPARYRRYRGGWPRRRGERPPTKRPDESAAQLHKNF